MLFDALALLKLMRKIIVVKQSTRQQQQITNSLSVQSNPLLCKIVVCNQNTLQLSLNNKNFKVVQAIDLIADGSYASLNIRGKGTSFFTNDLTSQLRGGYMIHEILKYHGGRLNSAPQIPNIHVYPGLQNMTLFGNRIFAVVIKLWMR